MEKNRPIESAPDAPPSAPNGLTPGDAQKFSKQDFQAMLAVILAEAADAGEMAVIVRAADLHARVGGYPGRGHSMPTCCTAMREAMNPSDSIRSEPTRGHGPSLQVRYRLPR